MKTGRCHIRLTKEMELQIKEYAKRHHTTISALIEQHFMELLREDRMKDEEIGEQI